MPLICGRFFLTTELDHTFRFTESAYAASTCELRSQGQLGRILSHRIDRQGAKPRTRFVGHGFSRDVEHQKRAAWTPGCPFSCTPRRVGSLLVKVPSQPDGVSEGWRSARAP